MAARNSAATETGNIAIYPVVYTKMLGYANGRSRVQKDLAQMNNTGQGDWESRGIAEPALAS